MGRLQNQAHKQHGIGGRRGARLLPIAAGLALFALTGSTPTNAAGPQSTPVVSVREDDGVYSVTARFDVPQPATTVLAVLTDYEHIPRFMPDVRTSVVRERGPGRALVEQEATASLMMFSKRIHLLLEVQEEPGTLRFRDMCGRSFDQYAGEWRLSERDGRSVIEYELVAKPAFSVPEFLLRRLLGRDARVMIERLRAEIAARRPMTT